MHFRPEAPATKLPIDQARIESAKGSWLVAVTSVAETIDGTTLLVGITLEQSIDDQSFRIRRLEAIVDSNAVREPENGKELLDRIRKWIESVDDDGFLDMTKLPS